MLILVPEILFTNILSQNHLKRYNGQNTASYDSMKLFSYYFGQNENFKYYSGIKIRRKEYMEREFPLIIFISAVWILTNILVTGFGLYYRKSEKTSGTRKSYKGLTAVALLSFLYPCIIGILLLISVGYIDLDI